MSAILAPFYKTEDDDLSNELDEAQDSVWMGPLISKLNKFALYVLADSEHVSRVRREVRFALIHTSLLENLHVTGWNVGWMAATSNRI
jgi:hypothetical protein